jgi:hypothetical protein
MIMISVDLVCKATPEPVNFTVLKVGWRLVDCKTGDIYYAPAGYEQVDGEWQTTPEYYQNHGRDVLNKRENYRQGNILRVISMSPAHKYR